MCRLAPGKSLSLTGVGSTAAVPIANCSGFIDNVAVLIWSENQSKIQLRYKKLKRLDKYDYYTYEETSNKSMID